MTYHKYKVHSTLSRALAVFLCALVLSGNTVSATWGREQRPGNSHRFAASSMPPPALIANGKIAFVRNLGSGNNEIFLMEADGGGQVNVTNNAANDFNPNWSPDGTKLTFASNRSGNSDIHVINADGTGAINLTANSSASELSPAWSPDGAKIAFVSDRDGNNEIYSMNADGSGQTRLTNNAAFDLGPAWSPDSLRIAFTTNRDGNFEIYVMSADGGGQTRLTNNSGDDSVPKWSPAGTRIAFSTTRDGNNEIYLMNADGGGLNRLTNNTAFDSDPVWSPDGNKLAFTSGRDGNNEIYQMNADGTGQTNLTLNSSSDTGPAWQPLADSQSFQFSAGAVSFGEGQATATLTVTRSGLDLSGASTVAFSTLDDPAAVPCAQRGTVAYARCDYATNLDTLTFAPNESAKTITLSLIDDAHAEDPETFQVQLSNPSPGTMLGATATVTVTLTDNDAAGQPNPVYASREFFVRQQYLDFLSREPDAGGFNAWLGVLNGCSNVDTGPEVASQCDRIFVSGIGFFDSQEFRLKGFYVFLFYQVAFDRLAEYTEIVADMRGVTGQTPADTFARRAAFADSFAGRAEFRAAYDGLTNQQYVDRLMNRYGLAQITTPDPQNPEGAVKVTLTRGDLVNRLLGLGGGALSRAQVLRAIVASDEVGAAENTQAFVAMQYYGYLRRTPETDGYNANVNFLNQNPTGFREIINGFLNSREYQLRFGPVER